MRPLPPETLGQLYRQYAPALLLYARQWPGQAEDVVQEAFVKLAQQNPPPEQIVAWLYRVVRNAALQNSRMAARRRRRESVASAAEAWFVTVDDQLDAREATRLLTELPLELRETVVARIWGGLIFEEIADLTGCSLATAHRRYQAALKMLRERLERQCAADHPQPDEMNNLENRLAAWQPGADGLAVDRMLYAAGRASASRPGRGSSGRLFRVC